MKYVNDSWVEFHPQGRSWKGKKSNTFIQYISHKILGQKSPTIYFIKLHIFGARTPEIMIVLVSAAFATRKTADKQRPQLCFCFGRALRGGHQKQHPAVAAAAAAEQKKVDANCKMKNRFLVACYCHFVVQGKFIITFLVIRFRLFFVITHRATTGKEN